MAEKFTSKNLRKALKLPLTAISYQVTCWLHELYPKQAVERSSGYFGLERYAYAGHCKIEPCPQFLPEFDLGYDGRDKSFTRSVTQSFHTVHWKEDVLQVLEISWANRYSSESCAWIIASSQQVAWNFFCAVEDYNNEVRGEILVFNGGCFSKDKQLFADIQSSRLENLVLPGNVKEEFAQDCQEFFESEELYARYGVPWKRGYILMGPPGNGKSHAVKALLNHLKKPCIYVQSFKADHETDHSVMRKLFKRARATTPCILVLEDLDSLINDGNRSFFLNELDGFSSNHGILSIATTNHPERLDPAILDRPSRFDRKYHFELPQQPERLTYLKLWNGKLEKDLRCAPKSLQKVAEATEGFSYAYLKELVLSSMMAWMRAPGQRKMDEVMLEITVPLAQQVTRSESEGPSYGEGDEDGFDPMAFVRSMSRRRR